MPSAHDRTGRATSRRHFLKTIGIGGGALATTPIWAAAAPKKRPNIVYLMTDDQRADTLSCVGHPQLKTPNIDQLAAEGTLFENAFVTTAICAPNRACVLAGQHTRTTGIKNFADPFTEEALDQTYPMVMRRDGYRVGFIGKWGVGANTEELLALPKSKFDYWRGFTQQGEFFHEVDGKKRHLTKIMADQAIEFFNEGPADQPFCLSISFKAPHGPWQDFDPEFADLFTGDDLPPLADSFRPEVFDALPEFLRKSLNGESSPGKSWVHGEKPEKLRNLQAMYYRLILGVDRAVGRIMKALDDLGVDDNTVVIFTSDHGHFLWEKGLFGKWLMYSESIRMPLIVRDPRLPDAQKGKRRKEMALNIDMAPTMLHYAGTDVPDGMQGMDLGPLVRGEDPEWRKDWFYEHTFTLAQPRQIAKSQGVRTERWKYIKYLDQNPYVEELYDMENDPREMRNLVNDPQHAKTLNHLRERYEYYRRTLPDNNPDPAEYGHFRRDPLSTQPHSICYDLTLHKTFGQTFVVEGPKIDSLEFMTATWGEKPPPAHGLTVQLIAGGPGGKVLVDHKVPPEQVRNNVSVPVHLETTLGDTLYLRVGLDGPIPKTSAGWWGYTDDVYPHGRAFFSDEPQDLDMRLVVTYEDPEGFVPTDRYRLRKANEEKMRNSVFRLAQGQQFQHHQSPDIAGKALVIGAVVQATAPNGVIVAQGGSGNGFAVYLKDGRLCMATRQAGKLTKIQDAKPFAKAKQKIEARLARDGTLSLHIEGKQVASGKSSGPIPAKPGDGLETGGDHFTAVGDYEVPNVFKGTIERAVVKIKE